MELLNSDLKWRSHMEFGIRPRRHVPCYESAAAICDRFEAACFGVMEGLTWCYESRFVCRFFSSEMSSGFRLVRQEVMGANEVIPFGRGRFGLGLEVKSLRL